MKSLFCRYVKYVLVQKCANRLYDWNFQNKLNLEEMIEIFVGKQNFFSVFSTNFRNNLEILVNLTVFDMLSLFWESWKRFIIPRCIYQGRVGPTRYKRSHTKFVYFHDSWLLVYQILKARQYCTVQQSACPVCPGLYILALPYKRTLENYISVTHNRFKNWII